MAADDRRADVIEQKIERLRGLVADLDNVYFNIKSERHSYYQGLLSLGDRRVADVIERAERNGGNWRAAVAEAGLDADAYLYRDRTRGRVPAVADHRRRHEDRASSAQELEKSARAEWTLPARHASRQLPDRRIEGIAELD